MLIQYEHIMHMVIEDIHMDMNMASLRGKLVCAWTLWILKKLGAYCCVYIQFQYHNSGFGTTSATSSSAQQAFLR